MLNIVCIKWGNKFTSAHVNVLYRSVKHRLKDDHNFVCFTDNAKDLDPGIDVRPLWNDFATMKGNYRKLKLYSEEILSSLNYNVIFLDLDTIVSGTLLPFSRMKENTLWNCPSIGKNSYVYNTSFVRIVDDTFCRAWYEFKKNPANLIAQAKAQCWTGTDQAIISYMFGGKTREVNEDDGIISFRDHQDICLCDKLPRKVRIVSFYHNSKYGDTSDPHLVEKYPWITEHWLSYCNDVDRLVLEKFQLKKSRDIDDSNRKKNVEYRIQQRKLRRKILANVRSRMF